MSRTSQTQSQALLDMSQRAFSVIMTLAFGRDLGDPGQLRTRVNEVFTEFDRDAREAGVSSDDVRSARFALTAFVDETIARSDWFGKPEWASRPLALEQFQTNNAGDEFFDELDKIRQRPDLKTDLLEVYYTCLTLGFEGKYALGDPRQLRDLISSIKSDLERIRGRVIDLSPHWEPPETPIQKLGREIPLWVVTAACLLILVGVFSILRYSSVAHAQKLAADVLSHLR